MLDYIKHSTAGLLSGAPAGIREITDERTVSSGSETWSITSAGSSRRGRLVPAILWEFVLFFLFFLWFVGQSKRANFKCKSDCKFLWSKSRYSIVPKRYSHWYPTVLNSTEESIYPGYHSWIETSISVVSVSDPQSVGVTLCTWWILVE